MQSLNVILFGVVSLAVGYCLAAPIEQQSVNAGDLLFGGPAPGEAAHLLLVSDGPFREAFKQRYPVCFNWMEEKLAYYGGSVDKLAKAIDKANPLDELALEFMAYCLLMESPNMDDEPLDN